MPVCFLDDKSWSLHPGGEEWHSRVYTDRDSGGFLVIFRLSLCLRDMPVEIQMEGVHSVLPLEACWRYRKIVEIRCKMSVPLSNGHLLTINSPN